MGDLLKIVVGIAVAIGLGMAVLKTPDGSSADRSSFTLFKDVPEPDQQREERGPAGVVIGHQGGALLILPWEDGGPVEVDATRREIRRCPVDAHYPNCVEG